MQLPITSSQPPLLLHGAPLGSAGSLLQLKAAQEASQPGTSQAGEKCCPCRPGLLAGQAGRAQEPASRHSKPPKGLKKCARLGRGANFEAWKFSASQVFDAGGPGSNDSDDSDDLDDSYDSDDSDDSGHSELRQIRRRLVADPGHAAGICWRCSPPPAPLRRPRAPLTADFEFC